jgi:hypothetical protein
MLTAPFCSTANETFTAVGKIVRTKALSTSRIQFLPQEYVSTTSYQDIRNSDLINESLCSPETRPVMSGGFNPEVFESALLINQGD